ncbi:MAG: hypothetical protein ACXWXF_05360 [Aeromicrobium sp.]
MHALKDPVELNKTQRYFKSGAGEYGAGVEFMGVRMGRVFQLAKEFHQLAAGRDREADGQPDP